MDRLLIHNIGQLVTPLGRSARRGQEHGKLQKLRTATVLPMEMAKLLAVTDRGSPPCWI